VEWSKAELDDHFGGVQLEQDRDSIDSNKHEKKFAIDENNSNNNLFDNKTLEETKKIK